LTTSLFQIQMALDGILYVLNTLGLHAVYY